MSKLRPSRLPSRIWRYPSPSPVDDPRSGNPDECGMPYAVDRSALVVDGPQGARKTGCMWDALLRRSALVVDGPHGARKPEENTAMAAKACCLEWPTSNLPLTLRWPRKARKSGRIWEPLRRLPSRSPLSGLPWPGKAEPCDGVQAAPQTTAFTPVDCLWVQEPLWGIGPPVEPWKSSSTLPREMCGCGAIPSRLPQRRCPEVNRNAG